MPKHKHPKPDDHAYVPDPAAARRAAQRSRDAEAALGKKS